MAAILMAPSVLTRERGKASAPLARATKKEERSRGRAPLGFQSFLPCSIRRPISKGGKLQMHCYPWRPALVLNTKRGILAWIGASRQALNESSGAPKTPWKSQVTDFGR